MRGMVSKGWRKQREAVDEVVADLAREGGGYAGEKVSVAQSHVTMVSGA